MPAPTKKWAEDLVHVDQPVDGYIERGFDPQRTFGISYLNWILNFIQSTLIGTEHDPFTGEHTDITADSVTTDTLTVTDALYADNDTQAVTVKAGATLSFEDNTTLSLDDSTNVSYSTKPTLTAWIGLSRWTTHNEDGVTGTAELLSDNAAYLRLGPVASPYYDQEISVDLDDIVPSLRTAGSTIEEITIYAYTECSSPALAWRLERRNPATALDGVWTTVDSGTAITASALGGGGAPTEIDLFTDTGTPGAKTILASNQYRLVLQDGGSSGTGTHSYHIVDVKITYKPARILPS